MNIDQITNEIASDIRNGGGVDPQFDIILILSIASVLIALFRLIQDCSEDDTEKSYERWFKKRTAKDKILARLTIRKIALNNNVPLLQVHKVVDAIMSKHVSMDDFTNLSMEAKNYNYNKGNK